MRRIHRHWFVLLILIGVAAVPRESAAQAKKKAPAATKADIDRLEAKIAEQQKLIDKLVTLQKQYLQALIQLFPQQGGQPTGDVKPPPGDPVGKVDDPKPPADPKPPISRVDPKPKPVKKEGAGTIVGKIAGAADAVVYVETMSASTKGTATMKQEGKQFLPQVLVVQKGTTVSFPNRDAIFHNVFSVTPDNSFDLGSYRQGETKTVTMSKPGVVNVYCNMHPQMVGHILVVPNGNYARAGKDGFFRLTNIPPGKHRVVAWAPNSKPVVKDADVTDAEVVTVEFELKKGRGGPHTKKDGMPYGSYEK
ncbi:MAG TPA: plastocyanin/azurin family copper-binding protein [Kofleriaceae bacterium]